MTYTGHALVAVSAALGLVAVGIAQQPAAAPAQDVLNTLRAKNALSEEDRGTLRAWLSERMGVVNSDNPAGAAAAMSELRGAPAAGTPAFREAFVGLLTELTRESYKSARLEAAARLVSLLAALNEPATYGLLIEALKDDRAAVRTAAAVGLRNLRVKLAVLGGNAVSETMAALRAAGRREPSAPALRAIYQALNYADTVPPIPNPPDVRANLAALLEILETRAAQHAARKVTAETADLAGLRALEPLRKSLNDEERRRYIAVLATMLRYYVIAYTGELYRVKDKFSSPQAIERRNHAELLIEEAEAQLAALLGLARDRAPSITEAMKNIKDDADRVKMKVEMNKWSDLLQKAIGQRFSLDEEPGAAEAPPPEGG